MKITTRMKLMPVLIPRIRENEHDQMMKRENNKPIPKISKTEIFMEGISREKGIITNINIEEVKEGDSEKKLIND